MGIGKVNSLAAASLSKVNSLAKLSVGKISSATASFAPAFSNQKSIAFDGTDDYVVFGNVTWGHGTLSLWFKTDEEESMPISIGSGQFLYFAEKIYLSWPTMDGYVTYNNRDYDDGNWHHLLYTINASETKVYYDGSLVYTDTDTEEGSTTAALWFGQYGGGGYYFPGNLDEISWWDDTTLDADAVTAVYNSGVPINLAADSGNYDNSGDLTHWWRMGDGDTFDTIEDNAGSLDGTMTNMGAEDIEDEVPS